MKSMLRTHTRIKSITWHEKTGRQITHNQAIISPVTKRHFATQNSKFNM